VTSTQRPGAAGTSQTALTAAAARAAHLIVDQPPVIFADPLALPLLGDQAAELVAYHRAHGAHVVLSGARGQATCRSRYTDDSLAAAIAGSGITQYLILGAGLDSFAYRSPLAGRVRVFEVDHPATQDFKLGQLSAAGIPVPGNVVFVPVDFETGMADGSLAERLVRSGFDLTSPAFVSWLGVTMYLTEAAIGQTLGEIGGFAPGSQVVADYMLPAQLRDEDGSTYAELVAPVAAEGGEPWLTFLSPAQMSALLTARGLTPLRHVAQGDVGDSATWQRSDSLRPTRLSLIAHAVVASSG
jgi:methyltransferase (TIGR00027 family)